MVVVWGTGHGAQGHRAPDAGRERTGQHQRLEACASCSTAWPRRWCTRRRTSARPWCRISGRRRRRRTCRWSTRACGRIRSRWRYRDRAGAVQRRFLGQGTGGDHEPGRRPNSAARRRPGSVVILWGTGEGVHEPARRRWPARGRGAAEAGRPGVGGDWRTAGDGRICRRRPLQHARAVPDQRPHLEGCPTWRQDPSAHQGWRPSLPRRRNVVGPLSKGIERQRRN